MMPHEPYRQYTAPVQKKRTHRGMPVFLNFMERVTTMPYRTLFLLWAMLLLGFGLAYYTLSTLSPDNGLTDFKGASDMKQFLNSVYFSIITATTVGYGDIVPMGISKILAAGESVLGFFLFAVFVTKLVSFRQEIALHQIHKLTFEDVFYNTREGLFIIRKDFDAIIAEAEETKSLKPHSWENLTIAYREGQTLLNQIPDFYDNDHHLYTIDARREDLLQEAVHRTLHRINQMLDVLSRAGINWASHEKSVHGLRELNEIVETVTPLWRQKSPSMTQEPFEEILVVNEGIRRKVEGAL